MQDDKKRSEEIHQIWWDFCDYMSQWYFSEHEDFDFVDGEIKNIGKFKMFDSTKMIGYEAICRVENYISEHKEIKIVNVDDAVYAGACVVLIPHPKHGITAIYIPQCTTNTNQWFLYPSHLKSMIENLNDLLQDFKYDEQ